MILRATWIPQQSTDPRSTRIWHMRSYFPWRSGNKYRQILAGSVPGHGHCRPQSNYPDSHIHGSGLRRSIWQQHTKRTLLREWKKTHSSYSMGHGHSRLFIHYYFVCTNAKDLWRPLWESITGHKAEELRQFIRDEVGAFIIFHL